MDIKATSTNSALVLLQSLAHTLIDSPIVCLPYRFVLVPKPGVGVRQLEDYIAAVAGLAVPLCQSLEALKAGPSRVRLAGDVDLSSRSASVT